MPDDLHELSALYALDLLDADERARFEEHLAECDRELELASRSAATALAYVGGPAPPADLRGAHPHRAPGPSRRMWFHCARAAR